LHKDTRTQLLRKRST